MLKVVDGLDEKKVEILQTETELKQCPFCGSDGEIVCDCPNYYYPSCSVCPAEIHEHYFTAEEAAQAWNERCGPKEPAMPWPYSVFGAMYETAKRAFNDCGGENTVPPQ